MQLDSIFPKRVITSGPESPLYEIAELMEQHGVGTVVITRDERPVGIVTDRDLALELGTGRFVRSEPVRAIMSEAITTIRAGCPTP